MMQELQKFWNTIGATKVFNDPFSFEAFLLGLQSSSRIVEYGCGYGRLLHLLHERGYRNLAGYDFAPNMISRGKSLFSNLDLQVLEKPLYLPLEDGTVDAVILSTVLTCIPEARDIKQLIGDLRRVLKSSGKIYISDFLITENEKYSPLYERDESIYGCYGTFMTSEGAVVRHFSKEWILELIQEFDLEWYEERPFVTMNMNPVNTFHLIGLK